MATAFFTQRQPLAPHYFLDAEIHGIGNLISIAFVFHDAVDEVFPATPLKEYYTNSNSRRN